MRPVICATSNAGLKGLSVYFLLTSSIILIAPIMSAADFNMNLTKFFIVLLSQTKAYISESDIKSTISDHSSSLSVSSDKNPLIKICTILHWVVVLSLFKFYFGFDPVERQTNFICGIFYLTFSKPSNKLPKVDPCKRL